MTKTTNSATVHADAANTPTPIQTGTIVEFYEVIKFSRCFVWLQQLSNERTKTLSMQGTTVPVAGTRAGKISKHKVYVFDENRVAIKFEHGAGATWDGEPKWFSSYA
ncbi:MAG: hypothetical protein WA324_15475 [Bryobacteraceae bacterium]